MIKETFEQEKKSSLKGRIIMAIIMLVVALPCVFFGSYFFAALVLFLAGIASYELVHALDTESGWWGYLIEGLFVVSMIVWGIFRGNLEMAQAFGFSLENYEKRFGSSFLDDYKEQLEKLKSDGLLVFEDNRVHCTDKGVLLLDRVLISLFK